ncbi:MAG: FHIPEP family type III secretion protein, partial [Pseudomonadota bacterium]|nr:FHIPEP family type III secretion protein [Pseudomonadota bacterium]
MADTSEQVPTPSGGGDPPAQTTGDAGGGVDGAGQNLMNGLPLGQFQSVFMRGDIALALGVVAILAILILPMPTWLLDLSLDISITFSILILMTVLFINRALDFNAFPTVLL